MTSVAARWTSTALWLMLLFAGVFFSGVYRNGFPYWYHWDEMAKADQVITGNLNFNHPLLLIQTAHGLHSVLGASSRRQSVVETGRTLSALFAAGAVVCVSVLVWRLCSMPAGIIAGSLAGFSCQLLTLSHHFKEDTALLFGWCLALVAFRWHEEKPSLVRTSLLGAACAVAASGKYIGVVLLLAAWWLAPVPARPVSAVSRVGALARQRLLLTAAFLVFFLMLNRRLVENLPQAMFSVRREVVEQYLNSTGTGRGLHRFLPYLNPLALVSALVWFGVPCRRRWCATEKLLWGSAVFLVLTLSGIERFVSRYVLPLGMTVAVLGTLGIFALSNWLAARRMAWGLSGCLNHTLAEDAVVACDLRSLMPNPETGAIPGLRRIFLLIPKWASERGSSVADWLQERGATHVVICTSYSDRYLNRQFGGSPLGQYSDCKERRPFYELLQRECPVLWEEAPGPVSLLQPGLRLHAIPRVGDREVMH